MKQDRRTFLKATAFAAAAGTSNAATPALAQKAAVGSQIMARGFVFATLRRQNGYGLGVRTDRGVLSLLDNRVTKTRYGQIFFDSLPDYGFTTNREDVKRFFNV